MDECQYGEIKVLNCYDLKVLKVKDNTKVIKSTQTNKTEWNFQDFSVVLFNTYKLTEAQIWNMSGCIAEGGT